MLRQIAKDHREEFPKAAAVIESQLYVDDFSTGVDSVEEGVELIQQIIQLGLRGKMTFRKWRTSSRSLLDTIPEDLHEIENTQFIKQPEQQLKALGIHWDIVSDTLHIAASEITIPTVPTKRNITSSVSKMFDLMGWFSPALVVAKAMVQTLWKEGMTWDEPAPVKIADAWKTWQEELPLITKHPIPHCAALQKTRREVQLHGFCDASNTAYGGIVFVPTVNEDTSTSVSLMLSKTHVAPLSPPGTIPRLELCGAQVLSKLLVAVMKDLDVPMENVFAWTDSTIVLCWLNMPPDCLNVYVSNRTAETIGRIPPQHWRHVPASLNPADMELTRGS